MDDWQSFDDYVNRNLSKSVADNGNGTGSPASGKMRLPLPDVGKRTKIQTPVPTDPEILPQTSIRFIKLPRRKPKPSEKEEKGGGLLSAATSLTTGSVKLGGTLFYLVIQWICVVLMALSTLRMAQNFWANRVTLGSIAGVVQEKITLRVFT